MSDIDLGLTWEDGGEQPKRTPTDAGSSPARSTSGIGNATVGGWVDGPVGVTGLGDGTVSLAGLTVSAETAATLTGDPGEGVSTVHHIGDASKMIGAETGASVKGQPGAAPTDTAVQPGRSEGGPSLRRKVLTNGTARQDFGNAGAGETTSTSAQPSDLAAQGVPMQLGPFGLMMARWAIALIRGGYPQTGRSLCGDTQLVGWESWRDKYSVEVWRRE